MSDAFAVVAVIISLGALGYSRLQALYSRKQLLLAERIRKEATDPYVVVDVEPRAGGSGLLVFYIQNIGATIARNVHVDVTPPLQSGERDDWDEKLARALSRPIPHLPPRRRLEWFFTFGPRYLQNPDVPRQYTVTVTSDGPSGAVEPMTYIIDLDVIRGMALDRESIVAKLDLIAENTNALKKLPPR
ncbi:hypothetical protein GCM10023205_80440 [Yinghuangia aomiensis]|uniref:Polyketide cyclase / dehydrase and lipid transport n=1 Tax=Yinghuangia aomiensis TaxID=676205 RepID=A0ABP9IFR5_9ACTN